MATMKEKFDDFVALLGGDSQLAESVVNKAEATEKEAERIGITSKEVALGVTETVKAKKVKVKKSYPKGRHKLANGKSPGGGAGSSDERAAMFANMEEAGTRTSAKAAKDIAAEESDPADTELDAGEVFDAIKGDIEDLIAEKLASVAKETSEKELGLTAQITALETKFKEVEAVAKTLAGDLPRSVKDGYRASRSASTITTKEVPNQPQADPLGDFYGWVTESLGKQPGA